MRISRPTPIFSSSRLVCKEAFRLASADYSHFSTASANSRDINIYYNDVFTVPLPEQHRFPMEKYKLIREGLQREYAGRKDIHFKPSPLASRTELETTHCKNYVSRFLNNNLTVHELRRIGFPYSEQFVQRTLSSVGGTVAATSDVLGVPYSVFVCGSSPELLGDSHRFRETFSKSLDIFTENLFTKSVFAAHLAGGTHHAFYDYGEGFCVFNDIAVAANLALNFIRNISITSTARSFIGNRAFNILVVDMDVHQGNGTAVLFDPQFDKESNVDSHKEKPQQNLFYNLSSAKFLKGYSSNRNLGDSRSSFQKEVLSSRISCDNRHHVFTCSFHCDKNYFSAKQYSDFDVELPQDMTDDAYLYAVETSLKDIFCKVQPTLVFYQAGVDIVAGDRLGRLNVSRSAAKQRNQIIFDLARSFDSKVVCTLGGGYPRDMRPDSQPFIDIVEAHKDVYRSMILAMP